MATTPVPSSLPKRESKLHGRLMVALAGDTELLPQDKQTLAHPAVGGVILFARNYGGSSALRQLTAAIRRAANRELVIATDHEGGRVQRFRSDGFTHVPAMAQLAAADNAAERVRSAGVVLAAELLAHGIDMTFAPVLDLSYGNSEVIGDRAFSADAEKVGELALQFAGGLAQAGMMACGKHFPGHGYVVADSHTHLPTDTRSKAQLQSADLQPFVRFAGGGGALLMTAHVIYSAVDEKPATFSARWLKDILRGELHYDGLVVSDDLCMAAAASIGDIAARVQAAADAGCDLLLLCQPQDNAAAIAAVAQLAEGGAHWQQLLLKDTSRLTVGDAAYRTARQLLLA